jgi:hypothetical protein
MAFSRETGFLNVPSSCFSEQGCSSRFGQIGESPAASEIHIRIESITTITPIDRVFGLQMKADDVRKRDSTSALKNIL